MTLVMGLDFGTGGVRVGVYDISARRMLAVSEAAYTTTQPRPGWAEQDPADWWSALKKAVGQAISAAGRADISGVSVATTASTVVACRRDGAPLRSAILWMDCRAAEQSRFTETIDHPVLAYSGHGDAVEWLVPKAMWLARHEAETYARADVICEAVDFVNFRLTGRWVGSQLNATCKWNYDPPAGRFYPELFSSFGVSDLLEKLPSEIVKVGEPVGLMCAEVAAELGLSGRPLVAQGGIDAHMGVFGAGTIAPGGMLMIGGTSVVHLTHTQGHRDIPGIWGPYPHALVDGLWLIEGGQVSAGSILGWLTERIFGLDAAGYAALVKEASALLPGSTGLMTLDYWMGNRTPYRDPDLRGAILGLSLWHDRAAIYRSVVDAIALGSANVIEDLAEKGVAVDHLVLAGGICRNPLWLKASIDAIGMPVHVALDDNLSLLGGAISAACALELFPDLGAASEALRAPVETIEPDPAMSARYRTMLGQYRQATTLIAPLAHELARAAVLEARP